MSRCDCYGCQMRGQGACGSSTCSECDEDTGAPLETRDVIDTDDGQRAYRPCAECVR